MTTHMHGDSPGGPEISIVIATRNRSALLERLLTALAAQRLPSGGVEFLVVDDQSDDTTPERLRAWHARLPGLRPLRTPGAHSLSAAAQHGVSQAAGRFLLFTDDDAIPAPDWILRMHEALESNPIVGGAVDAPRARFIGWCHHIGEFHAFCPWQPAGPARFLAGVNMGLRQEVLETLGGYPSNNCCPDTELALRAARQGIAVTFCPAAIVRHAPPRQRVRNLWRYSHLHARSTIVLRQAYRDILRTPALLSRPTLLRAMSPLVATYVTLAIYARSPRLLANPLTVPFVFLQKLAWCFGAAYGLTRHRRDPAYRGDAIGAV